MSNTISPPNPNNIDLREDVGVWQYPALSDSERNAADARDEYEHRLYVNALANPEASAIETAQPPAFHEGTVEHVPASGELHAYATNAGNSIDPAHAEAVLAATTNVADIYAAQTITEEKFSSTQEYNAAAGDRAGALGFNVVEMRSRAFLDWGKEKP